MITEPIKIAVLAMGGEGGGVLADWIVSLAEHNGFLGQNTSVPGVAQRTGATIYYVEVFPEPEDSNKTPVLGLMPMAGDVDIVLASELMEAGRAMQRGFVTRDKTTLISSSSRVFSIAEKTAMGDGRVESETILQHAQLKSKQCITFDMAKAAEVTGSVISAVLFGALCGSGNLPFNRLQFEDTIRRGGVGVDASLRAFERGFLLARGELTEPEEEPFQPRPLLASPHPSVVSLTERLRELPKGIQETATEGVRRVVDYQDPDYGRLYLERVEGFTAEYGHADPIFVSEVARSLALWMTYEDTIRVADLKTRRQRFLRVKEEVKAGDDQMLSFQEYMHPRMQEICETLPLGLGLWLLKPHALHRVLARLTEKGRVVKTSSLSGFLMLSMVAGIRRWRRSTLRYQQENQRIEQWLQQVKAAAEIDTALATELARCQNLVKGYGDTHARGLKNFHRVTSFVKDSLNCMSPMLVAELRETALADEHGKKLEALIASVSPLQGGARG